MATILNYPHLSANDIADIMEQAFEENRPIENSYLEDAITHIRELIRLQKNKQIDEQYGEVCSKCYYRHKNGTCFDS